jgi:hypothetical protein
VNSPPYFVEAHLRALAAVQATPGSTLRYPLAQRTPDDPDGALSIEVGSELTAPQFCKMFIAGVHATRGANGRLAEWLPTPSPALDAKARRAQLAERATAMEFLAGPMPREDGFRPLARILAVWAAETPHREDIYRDRPHDDAGQFFGARQAERAAQAFAFIAESEGAYANWELIENRSENLWEAMRSMALALAGSEALLAGLGLNPATVRAGQEFRPSPID